MTRKEYLNRRKELQAKHESDLQTLAELYARDNNPVKVGDIISDGIQTIKVESMEVESKVFPYPTMRYNGKKLMKNGKPYKRSLGIWTFQNYLITINGVPVRKMKCEE